MEYRDALARGLVPGAGGAGGVFDAVVQEHMRQSRLANIRKQDYNPATSRMAGAYSQPYGGGVSAMMAQGGTGGAPPATVRPQSRNLAASPYGTFSKSVADNTPQHPGLAILASIGSGYGSKFGGGWRTPNFHEGQLGELERQAMMQTIVDINRSDKGASKVPVEKDRALQRDVAKWSKKIGYTMKPEDWQPSWEKNAAAQAAQGQAAGPTKRTRRRDRRSRPTSRS